MKLTKSATEEVDATLTRLARGQEERRGEKRRQGQGREEVRVRVLAPRVGSTDVTWAADGCGFPRIKLESAHTALRRGPI